MPVDVLRCRICESEYPAVANGICARCFGPLEPVYDWDELARTVTRERIEAGPLSLWRYADLLPAIPPEDVEVLGPFVSLCRALGRIAVTLAHGSSIDRIETEFLGRIAERDTRLLSIYVLLGVLSGHVDEEVNEVNAPAMAEERGIEVAEIKRSSACSL